jgi:hypothetical protein
MKSRMMSALLPLMLGAAMYKEDTYFRSNNGKSLKENDAEPITDEQRAMFLKCKKGLSKKQKAKIKSNRK